MSMEHMGSNHQTKPGKPLYGSDARTRREAKVVGNNVPKPTQGTGDDPKFLGNGSK